MKKIIENDNFIRFVKIDININIINLIKNILFTR